MSDWQQKARPRAGLECGRMTPGFPMAYGCVAALADMAGNLFLGQPGLLTGQPHPVAKGLHHFGRHADILPSPADERP